MTVDWRERIVSPPSLRAAAAIVHFLRPEVDGVRLGMVGGGRQGAESQRMRGQQSFQKEVGFCGQDQHRHRHRRRRPPARRRRRPLFHEKNNIVQLEQVGV